MCVHLIKIPLYSLVSVCVVHSPNVMRYALQFQYKIHSVALQWRVLLLIVSNNTDVCSISIISLGRDQFGGSNGSGGGGGNKNSFDLFGTNDPFSVSVQRIVLISFTRAIALLLFHYKGLVCETSLIGPSYQPENIALIIRWLC